MSFRQPTISRPIGTAFQDEIIPGYTGFMPGMRMGTAAICGTYTKCHQASKYNRGIAGAARTLDFDNPTRSLSPNDYYRSADPRYKTNSKNKSSIVWGDLRDIQFKTMNGTNFCPPPDTQLAPALFDMEGMGVDEIRAMYRRATQRVGEEGVRMVERAMMSKLQQRTAGGQGGLRSAFKYFDRDASGTIDLNEFFKVLEFIGFTFGEDQVVALFGHYDRECNGELDYYAFIHRVLDGSASNGDNAGKNRRYGAGGPLSYKIGANVSKLVRWDVKRVFDKFDFDKSGSIDVKEFTLLLNSLGLYYHQDRIDKILAAIDLNRNGSLDFEEFYKWFETTAERKDLSATQSINLGDLKLAY